MLDCCRDAKRKADQNDITEWLVECTKLGTKYPSAK